MWHTYLVMLNNWFPPASSQLLKFVIVTLLLHDTGWRHWHYQELPWFPSFVFWFPVLFCFLFLAHTADFIMQLTTVYTLVIVRYSIWKMSFTVWEYSLGNLLFSSTSVILIYVGVDIWIPVSIPSNVELHFLKDLHLPISYRSISNKHHLYMYWKNFEEKELASSFCLWVLSKEVFSYWRRIKFCALASHFVCVCSYFYKKNLKTSIYCFPSKLNLVLSVDPHPFLNVLIDHNYRLAMNMRVAICIPKETFC